MCILFKNGNKNASFARAASAPPKDGRYARGADHIKMNWGARWEQEIRRIIKSNIKVFIFLNPALLPNALSPHLLTLTVSYQLINDPSRSIIPRRWDDSSSYAIYWPLIGFIFRSAWPVRLCLCLCCGCALRIVARCFSFLVGIFAVVCVWFVRDCGGDRRKPYRG